MPRAKLSDGRLVSLYVVNNNWEGTFDGAKLYGQFYDANNVASGPPVLLYDFDPNGGYLFPQVYVNEIVVKPTEDGRFAVVFQYIPPSFDPDQGFQSFGRIFDGTGAPYGQSFFDDSNPFTHSDYYSTDVTDDGNGRIAQIIAYDDHRQLRTSVYDEHGAMLNTAVIGVGIAGHNNDAHIAGIGDHYLATWTNVGNGPGTGNSALAALLDKDGNTVSTFTVASDSYGSKVTALEDGFLVAWTSATGSTIHAQVYGVDGVAVGAPVTIGTGVVQRAITLDDGGFALAWTTSGTSGQSTIHVQAFTALGVARGAEFTETKTITTDVEFVPMTQDRFVLHFNGEDHIFDASHLPNDITAPTIGDLTSDTVAENERNGTIIGTVPSTDDGPAGDLRYSLIDDAGGRVAIDPVTGAIRVQDRLLLDFEQASSFSIQVRVTDGMQNKADRAFTINLTDVMPEIVTGDARHNVITSGAGNDMLNGGGGTDTLIGGAGNDIYFVDRSTDAVIENVKGGTDIVRAATSYTLAAKQEIEILKTTSDGGTVTIKLSGNEFANTIMGNAGINTLDGGKGADTLTGGKGNDTYIVDNVSDKVVESAGSAYGRDTVKASVSDTLAANVETLVFTGTGNLAGTGNALANTITGNSGANVLDGGLGNDLLIGGTGKDTFFFDTRVGSTNIDQIKDFKAIDDTIKLENAIFKVLTKTGTLSMDAFKDLGVTGAKVDDDDRILYNHKTGVLSYDADGSGATDAVQFATLNTHPTLTHADILIV